MLVFAALFVRLLAQQNPEAIREAMRASLARQQESVRVQAQAAAQAMHQASSGVIAMETALSTADHMFADCEPLAEPVVNDLIRDAAQAHGLDPGLIREVARQESAFRPCAVSGKGALGLMQLMPGTARDLEVENPFDPRENITAGSRFLKFLLDRYDGDIASALGAYNAGPARVDKAGGVPAIPETRQYVSKILDRLAPDQ